MISLRDELFKKFGTHFKSSMEDYGVLTLFEGVKFPLNEEQSKKFISHFLNFREHFNFHMLLDISCEKSKERSLLHYQLLNLEVHFGLRVTVDLGESIFFPSVESVWKSACALEAELVDRFELVKSSGKTTEHKRVLRGKEQKLDEIQSVPSYDLPLKPTASQKRRSWRRFGPFSSPFNGRARVDYLLDGDHVYDAQVMTGFAYRGFENKGKELDPFAMSHYFERLCKRDSVFAPLLWVETVESTMAIEVPEKARALRMVWMELARVEGHLQFLKELSEELGFYVEASTFSELLEQVFHLYNLYSGKSQNFSLFTFGGMRLHAPLGWGTECLEIAKYIHKTLEQTGFNLMRSPSWMEATRGCPLSAGAALDYGFSGPNLRACGVNYDARKIKPSYFYRDVDFEVPLGIDGTTYDRFLVRLEEVKQSLRIINQVLDHLPAGELLNTDHSLADLLVAQTGTQRKTMENLSYRQGLLSAGHTYTTIEASEGQIGLSLNILEGGVVNHFHIRSPSLAHISAFASMTRGQDLSCSLVAFSSLSIDAWEMDR
jgi:NADH:ubiquinone oxidoreductase subunit D